MTKNDYKQSAYYLIYLIRCVLNNKIPAKEKLDKMDLSSVFAVAKAHSLTVIAAYALESAGIIDQNFEEEKYKAIRKEIIFDDERKKVLSELEKAGIWYMPLKGIVIKDLYPKIGMRQMCDNDILFDDNYIKELKTIMFAFGYKMKHDNSGHDIAFTKQPFLNFEMHTHLFGGFHKLPLNNYYGHINQKLIRCNNNNHLRFSNEDFYIFMVAHEYKHYRDLGGTGIRNLVDRYIFLNHFCDTLNMTYIKQELAKMQIDDYERTIRKIVLKLFNRSRLTKDESQLLDYYIFSGTYGAIENFVYNKVTRYGNNSIAKWKYAFSRILVPLSINNPHYKEYKVHYPQFYKLKILLPFLPLYRAIRSLIKSKSRILTEINALLKI